MPLFDLKGATLEETGDGKIIILASQEKKDVQGIASGSQALGGCEWQIVSTDRINYKHRNTNLPAKGKWYGCQIRQFKQDGTPPTFNAMKIYFFNQSGQLAQLPMDPTADTSDIRSTR